MSYVHIRGLWITRKSIDGGFHFPELVEAWDEYSIDENPIGWQEACERALTSIGSDLASHRYIDIRVGSADIERLFEPDVVEGAVSTDGAA